MKISYSKTNWVDDDTPISAENLNNIEKGIESLYLNALGLSDLKGGSGINITDTSESGITISLKLNKVPERPRTSYDDGNVGDYYLDLDEEYLYFCINNGNDSSNSDIGATSIKWIKIKLDLRF